MTREIEAVTAVTESLRTFVATRPPAPGPVVPAPAEPTADDRMSDLFRTLPRQLRIGPFDYTVKVVDTHGEWWGKHDGNRFEMRISDTFSQPAALADTMVHEVLHALWRERGLSEAGHNDEMIVRGFGTGLVQVLRDNPAFAAWLLEATR